MMCRQAPTMVCDCHGDYCEPARGKQLVAYDAATLATKFLGVARSFDEALRQLEPLDEVEARELLGCTLIEVARIFDR